MDDHDKPLEAGGHPLQGPHWHRGEGADGLVDFVPLRLVLQPGGQTVQLIRPDMVIGRHTDADVRLPLPDVSRRHCRCVFENGGWSIHDLNSLNGIYVNGEKVQKAALQPHDTVTIGGFTFEVHVGEGPQTAPLPQQQGTSDADLLQSIANALPANLGVAGERRLAS